MNLLRVKIVIGASASHTKTRQGGIKVMFSHELEYIFNEEYRKLYDSVIEEDCAEEDK